MKNLRLTSIFVVVIATLLVPISCVMAAMEKEASVSQIIKPDPIAQLPSERIISTKIYPVNSIKPSSATSISYDYNLYCNEINDNESYKISIEDNKQFLEDIQKYTKEKNEKILTIEKKEKKRMFLYILPRPSFMIGSFRQGLVWFNKKDSEYSENNESAANRQEWETLLGFDIFHPYYKCKEVQEKIKDKYTFKGPKNIKVRPTYQGKQLKITFIKKF